MKSLKRRKSFSEDFSLFDVDGDNTITKSELVAALRHRLPEASSALADTWATGVMRVYDHDGNGSLDRQEFANFMNTRHEELAKIFDELDRTKSGRIQREDVSFALQQANVPHMAADIDRVLRRMAASSDDATFASVTADGVDFAAFFHASLLLPVHNSESMLLLTSAGAIPVVAPPPGTTPSMIVAAGFINGAVSRTLTAPTDRLRAVLATGVYPDVRSAVRGILREQGALGFWSANLSNVIQVAPENGISFALNELLRDRLCADPEHPAVVEKFLLGGLAGAVAMSCVYPMYGAQRPSVALRTDLHGPSSGLPSRATEPRRREAQWGCGRGLERCPSTSGRRQPRHFATNMLAGIITLDPNMPGS